MAYPAQTDPTAVFGRRVLAALIDFAILLVPTIMLITSALEYLEVSDIPGDPQEFCDAKMDDGDGICINFEDVDDRVYFSDGVPAEGAAYFWGANFGLLVLLQAFTGWTIGKLLTGIRVVQEDGRPPGFLKALVRWLLWIVDGFPYVAPLVGFIVGLTTVGHRRVGDMAASTFVVRSAAAGSPIVVPGLTPSPPVGSIGTWDAPTPDAGSPGSPGWAAPGAAPPAAPPSDRPQWDAARNTYIQWDPQLNTWMQWDETLKTWSRIPGQ